jgi:hypothetical protein
MATKTIVTAPQSTKNVSATRRQRYGVNPVLEWREGGRGPGRAFRASRSPGPRRAAISADGSYCTVAVVKLKIEFPEGTKPLTRFREANTFNSSAGKIPTASSQMILFACA